MNFIEKVKWLLLEPSETFNASKEETLVEAIKYYFIVAAIYSAISSLWFASGTYMGKPMVITFGMLTGAGAGITLFTPLVYLFPPAGLVFPGFPYLWINLNNFLIDLIPKAAGINEAILLFVIFLILAIVSALIYGALYHIGVYILGGRKGIAQTIKATMYGSIPGLLFMILLGWIPFGWIPNGIVFIASIWSLGVGIIGISRLQELTIGKAIAAVILSIVLAAWAVVLAGRMI